MIPIRLARELTYQLEHAEEHERLANALACVPVFLVLWGGKGESEILGYWQELVLQGHTPEDHYRTLIELPRADTSALQLEALKSISDLLIRRTEYVSATALLTKLLYIARDRSNEYLEMVAEAGLGKIDWTCGDYDQAITRINHSLTIARRLDDKTAIANTLGEIGIIHFYQCRYSEAMLYYQQQLGQYKALDDKHGMAKAIGRLGSIHFHLGRSKEALDCYHQQLHIFEQYGDKSGMLNAFGNMGLLHAELGHYKEALQYSECQYELAVALGDKRGMLVALDNMGNVYADQGELPEAIARYNLGLDIAKTIGDKSGISDVIGNLGCAFTDQGRYTEAIACYEEKLVLDKSLSNSRGMSLALGNMGCVYNDLGRYPEAISCFYRSLEWCERIGDIGGIAIALVNIGEVQTRLRHYDEALELLIEALGKSRENGDERNQTYALANIGRTMIEQLQEIEFSADHSGNKRTQLEETRRYIEECSAMSKGISKPDTIFSSGILFARIEEANGNSTLATEKLHAMLAEATEEEQIADLHYWLWKIGNQKEHKNEALQRYESLRSRIPKFEFVKRIAELKGERVPLSANDLEETI